MGEMADYYSDIWACGEEDESRYFGDALHRPTECKYCGSTNVEWHLIGTKYRMFNIEPNTPHYCKQYYQVGKLNKLI